MNANLQDFTPPAGSDTAATLRWYGGQGPVAGTPLVLHFHGGAFTDGSLDDGAPVAEALAAAGAVVASIDYPLAPAHKFPAAVRMGYAALGQLARLRGRRARAVPLYVAGEEAGGNIAAAVAMMARDRGDEIAGQILVDPLLDPCIGTPSMRNANAGEAGRCKYADGWHHYFRSPQDADHPYAAPASARRIAGLPATLIVATVGTPLRDEVMAYSTRLSAGGISTHLFWADQRGLRAERARQGALRLFESQGFPKSNFERTAP